jgi:hypothetical protein
MAIYPYMKFPYINRRNAKIWEQYGRISLRTLSHIPIYPYTHIPIYEKKKGPNIILEELDS